MKKVNYMDYLDQALGELNNNGVFLTVEGKKLNTMTIGWASFGVIWGEPILMVLVRKSRFTYQLIDNNDEFSVSVPENNKLKEELMFCGSKSGKNFDKFKECNLTSLPGEKINTPVIGECKLHFECKIKYKQDMKPENLIPDYNNKWYSNNDYHTLYFGKIVDTYLND